MKEWKMKVRAIKKVKEGRKEGRKVKEERKEGERKNGRTEGR